MIVFRRWPVWLGAIFLTLAISVPVLLTGCGGSESTATTEPDSDGERADSTDPDLVDLGDVKPLPPREPKPKDRESNIFTNSSVEPDVPANEPPPKRGLGDLLDDPESKQDFGLPVYEPMAIDEERVKANGIRKIVGNRLTLYTDLPTTDEIAGLPAIFDQAVPQWSRRFAIDDEKLADWKMTGFLMNDRDKFRRAGVLPADLPEFREGYQKGLEFWFDEQEEDYYRRHLMLHEGTHGYMRCLLGGAGPPWFMEGMAELLATHHWENNTLTLNVPPQRKEETPGWGRIRIIKDEFQAGRGMSPSAILQYGPTAHIKNAPYAWSWALCWFFDQHPDYQKEFRNLTGNVRNETLTFSQQFYLNLKEEWPRIQEQWQVFVVEADYGYDLPAAVIQYAETPLRRPENEPDPLQAIVASDRGWQSTGIELSEGVSYDCAVTGQFQVKTSPETWECTGDGVTLEYHRGQPLGLLLAAIRPADAEGGGVSILTQGEPLGSRRTLTPAYTGVLFVRVNEAAGELADNRGELKVFVRPTTK